MDGASKLMKLCFLPSKLSCGDLLCEDISFNSVDLPKAEPNFVLDIFQAQNDDITHFLVKVPSNLKCMPARHKDHIHLPYMFSKRFKELRTNSDVHVKVLSGEEVKTVSLHYAELVFKDQYYSRSDMLRMRNTLMGKILYHDDKVEQMKMKARVEELFCGKTMVSCGLVTEGTRLSFRSATAQVHIFLQMSREMWLFDNYGELLIEKALNGYLHDLFELWNAKGCAHDVTITLFSRTFYEARSLEDFPKSMRECIKEDYAGRFYEDYYRVVVQNECYVNWMPVIRTLKSVFTTYDADVLHFHEKQSCMKDSNSLQTWNPQASMGMRVRERSCSETGDRSQVEEDEFQRLGDLERRNSLTLVVANDPPSAWNSTAAEGNVLEVINMALNVYEKFYIDRCFERTGKISLVISPGNGVFDVNRDLMNITKQRSIDIGSSCDVICLGEKPMFFVPLFKINERMSEYKGRVSEDDYNIPHWLNLSFYKSRSQDECQLQQRVMLNLDFLENIQLCNNKTDKQLKTDKHDVDFNNNNNSVKRKLVVHEQVPLMNHEEYDSKVFKYQNKNANQESFTYLPFRTTRFEYGDRRERVNYTIAAPGLFNDNQQHKNPTKNAQLPDCSEEFLSHSFSGKHDDEDNSLHCKRMVGSVTTPYIHYRRQLNANPDQYTPPKIPIKTLVNPFYPSLLKTTSNKTRWSHAYPTGLPSSYSNSEALHRSINCSPSRESLYSEGSNSQMTSSAYKGRPHRQERLSECSEPAMKTDLETPPRNIHQNDLSSSLASSNNELYGSLNRCRSSMSSKHQTNYFKHSQRDLINAEGRVDSFPVNNTMDWKTMTVPPILPITNDYCPDNQTLEQKYLFAEYALVSEEIDNHSDGVYGLRKAPTLKEVFNEMIYQRVAQGFQIVIPKSLSNHSSSKKSSKYQHNVERVMLSMGRLFHYLTINEKDIVVRRYFLRHKLSQQATYDYSYRFQVPDSFDFDSSVTCFKAEPLDNYNWNYVDHHLLTQGEDGANMDTKLKLWRSRYVVLPSINSGTKEIQDQQNKGVKGIWADIYAERSSKENEDLVNSFIKFIESVNSITTSQSRRNERRGSLGLSSFVQFQKSEPLELKGHCQQIEPRKNEQFIKYDESTPLSEVVKAMLDPVEGLNFIKCQLSWVNLPQHSFSSPEAISWLKKHVNCLNPTTVMNSLIDHHYICHASDDNTKRFVFGYKIYYILPEKGKKMSDTEGYKPQIEQNFVEVEILIENDVDHQARRRHTHPHSMLKIFNENRLKELKRGKAKPLYKHVRIDIDYKEDQRQEWGVLKHHQLYTPTCAFDLGIEWLVATGSILGEKVFGWARKTGTQFHMLPIPSDPFALPFLKHSDPLRGPIYIPMDIKCLEGPNWPNMDHGMLLDFQDSVLKSFGFMRDRCITSLSLSEDYMISKKDELPKYIHCTGGMLMMVVSTLHRVPKKAPQQDKYEDFIIKQYHKQVSLGADRADESKLCSLHTVGFLWAWNFMLTKRWVTGQTGNEGVHDTILQDLRAFNSNKDGRLKAAWENFKVTYSF